MQPPAGSGPPGGASKPKPKGFGGTVVMPTREPEAPQPAPAQPAQPAPAQPQPAPDQPVPSPAGASPGWGAPPAAGSAGLPAIAGGTQGHGAAPAQPGAQGAPAAMAQGAMAVAAAVQGAPAAYAAQAARGYGAPAQPGHGAAPQQGYGAPQPGYGAATQGGPGVPAVLVGEHWPVADQLLAALPPPNAQLKADPLHSDVVLNQEGSLAQILGQVVHLHRADKEAEQKKRTLNIIGIILIVVGFLTVWLLIGFLFLIAGGIVYWIRSKVGATDVEDRKLEIVSGTLRTFGPEFKAKRPIKAVAEFAFHARRPPAFQQVTGTGLFEQKVSQEAFAHWWLSMSFTLKDGVTVTADASTHAKRKSMQKRKYTKIKERFHERLNVKLVPPKGKTFDSGLQSRTWGQQNFAGITLERAVIRPRYAVFRYRTGQSLRMQMRTGWNGQQLENQLDSRKVVAAIVNSYKAVASANRAAA
jgi:hypothetical protein